MSTDSPYPGAVLRHSWLYSDDPSACFHYVCPDICVFVAGGEPICLIRHERGDFSGEFRPLTDIERLQWDLKRIIVYREPERVGWTPLPLAP